MTAQYYEIIRRRLTIPDREKQKEIIWLGDSGKITVAILGDVTQITARFHECGMTTVEMNVSCQNIGDENEEVYYYYLNIVGSRLETEEEMEARCDRLQKLNAETAKRESNRVDMIIRTNEMRRIMEGLSLEQLKAMPPIKLV